MRDKFYGMEMISSPRRLIFGTLGWSFKTMHFFLTSNVFDNVAFGLKMKNWKNDEIKSAPR